MLIKRQNNLEFMSTFSQYELVNERNPIPFDFEIIRAPKY